MENFLFSKYIYYDWFILKSAANYSIPLVSYMLTV